MRITITNQSGAVRQVEALEAALDPQRLAPVVERWGEEVVLPWFKRNWGRGWTPLSPYTVREKQRLGFPDIPLVRTGQLFAAATERGAKGNIFEIEADGSGVTAVFGVRGDEIPYAVIQHDGGGRIPARPWDDLSGQPITRLGEMIAEEIRKGAG